MQYLDTNLKYWVSTKSEQRPWSLQKYYPTLSGVKNLWHAKKRTQEEPKCAEAPQNLVQSAAVDRCLSQVFQINNSDSPSPWDCGWQCACVCARFCVNTWVNSTHSDKGKHRRYAVRSLSHSAAVSVINAADGALSGAWTWTWHQTSCSHSSQYTHTSRDAVWVVKYWPTLSADV